MIIVYGMADDAESLRAVARYSSAKARDIVRVNRHNLCPDRDETDSEVMMTLALKGWKGQFPVVVEVLPNATPRIMQIGYLETEGA